MKEIVVFGAGGHAKVVIDIIEKEGKYKISKIVDFKPINSKLLDYSIISEQDFFESDSINAGIIAIGDNYLRFKLATNIQTKFPAFEFISTIHPGAEIGSHVEIKHGTCVMANATINSSSSIGSHVIVNTSSCIDHDCVLDDYSSLAPRVALGGNCKVGRYSAISIGASVIHNINIEENVVVGAGAVVIRNLARNSLYIGVPAKLYSVRKIGEKYL